MSDLDELRAAVAARHGLPEGAVRFLSATTVEALETQADALARLISASREREPEPEPQEPEPVADIFANIAANKAARNRAIFEALHGPRPQPRDQVGRYASFDGGARRQVPLQSPEEAHDDLVVELAQLSRTFGRRF